MSDGNQDHNDNLPDAIKLTTFAILGGVAGKPVSVSFRDFPPDVLAAIGGHFRHVIGGERVAEVFSEADVRQVHQDIEKKRLVLIYPANGKVQASNSLEWLIEHRRGGDTPLPAVLSAYQKGSNETPGSTLVIDWAPDLGHELVHWFSGQRTDTPAIFEGEWPSPKCHRLMDAIRHATNGESRLSLRDTRIVEGLVAGAAVHRYLRSGELLHPLVEANPEDYSEVRRLLEQSFSQNVHIDVDDFGKAMIERANLWLELQSPGTTNPARPIGARRGSSSSVGDEGQSGHPRLLSRTVVADLGNTRSQILKDLVQDIVRKNDESLLARLGLPRQETLANCRDSNSKVNQVLARIPTWTYKQVRSRFDRLEKEGLIEARKHKSNSPCQYILPLELMTQRSRFAVLPADNAVCAQYR